MSSPYRINVANKEKTEPKYQPTILLLDMLEYAGISSIPDVNNEYYLNVVEWFESFYKEHPDYNPDIDSKKIPDYWREDNPNYSPDKDGEKAIRDFKWFNWDTIMIPIAAKYESGAGTLDAEQASTKWRHSISEFAQKARHAAEPMRSQFNMDTKAAQFSAGGRSVGAIKGNQIHDAYRVKYADRNRDDKDFKKNLNYKYKEYLQRVAQDFGETIKNHYNILKEAAEWGGGKKSKRRKSKRRKSKKSKRRKSRRRK